MKEAIAVLGATATGKTGLALRLAERLGGEIVNADALQIYRGFDIGTAKPTLEEQRRVPHHLIDILDPQERYSAGDFARRARETVREVRERGGIPFIVGGSGLYLKALFEGLAEMPEISPDLRSRLRERLTQEGLPVLRRELQEVDPQSVERLTAGDSQRILRALEIWLETGRTMTDWLQSAKPEEPPLKVEKIGLTLPRPLLYDKISDRARAMLKAGWVEEVAALLTLHPLDAPAFQAIGYRELARALARRSESSTDGLSSVRLTAEEFDFVAAEISTATRRYAKRQETWFRKETQVNWWNSLELEPAFEGIVQSLQRTFHRM